jgi:hypothetical protein
MASGVLGVFGLAGFAAAGAAVDESKLPPAATNRVEFLRDIKPILDAHCLKCHGPEKPKSRFRIDDRAALLKGGENGVDVIPKESAKSPLIHFVSGLVEDMEMPPKGKGDPLTAQQIGLLRAWIDQDLPWAGGPATPTARWEFAPAGGWLTVRGDEHKFRELEYYREGWNGGLESFLIQDELGRPGEGSKLTLSGHALRDDYKFTLAVESRDGRFIRAGYEQFRKYYDDSGGTWSGTVVPPLGKDLHLDLGHAWIEAGGITAFGLQLVGGYEYNFREGEKSTLQWMPTDTPAGPKSILPNSKEIDEQRHLLRLDARYDWREWQFKDSFRYEFYDLDTHRPFVVAGFPAVTANQRMAEGTDTRNLANAFQTEVQPWDWLLLSAGYLFTHSDGENSFRQTSTDATGAPATGQLWNGSGITLDQHSQVLNANLQLGLWEQMTFSSGVQTEWNRQHTFGRVHLDETDFLDPNVIILNTNFVSGDYDRFTAEEKVTLRNTQLPYTVLYGEARFRQEEITQIEQLSPAGAGFPTIGDFFRNTDACSDWKQYRAGFTVSPWTQVSWNGWAQRRDRETQYDHRRDERPIGNPGLGYPAFITDRESRTDELGTKLSVRPARWLKTTFGYKFVTADYETTTDETASVLGPAGSPGGQVLAGQYDAHVYSLNMTVTPWRRLYLFSTFSYQDSRTVTEDHGSLAIAPYHGHVYSVINSGQYALTESTDLNLTYDFSYADYAQHNEPDGLPLGLDYRRHGLRAGVGHRFLQRFLANLEYVWSFYDEPSSDHQNDFGAHGFFATLNVRWK